MFGNNHTPLPWYTLKIGNGGYAISAESKAKNDAYITDTFDDSVYVSKVDADFIVQACNSHYELLNGLKQLVDICDTGRIVRRNTIDEIMRIIAKAEGN